MDEHRSRIRDDLRGLLGGELLFAPVERAPYSRDASLYEIDPLGVVCPRHEGELVALVGYAAERQIPLHARGAGTGLAGGCLGRGIVVDFARHMRRVVEVRDEEVVAQAGVVVDALNAQLAPTGRRLGPDPGGASMATVGGIVGDDAAGARSLRYGSTADAVASLRVVLAGGEVATLCREPRPAADDEPGDRRAAIARQVARLTSWNAERIGKAENATPRNRAGYALGAAGDASTIDLSRLVVGSEGTLALVTEATLRTVPIPAAVSAVLLAFGRLGDAAEAVVACLEAGPSALELHDWRSLSLLRDADPALRLVLADAEAALVVGFEGDDPGAVGRAARRLGARAARLGRLVADPVVTGKRVEAEHLLGLRQVILPLLFRGSGPRRPVPLIDDIAVPPERLAELLARLQVILKGHGLSWTMYAHAGAGQLHARPFLDMGDPEDLAKLEPLAAEVVEAALELGGTISGEHGCGLVRSQFVRRQYGDLASTFREVKNAFDPQGLLNPGKVVADDPHLLTKDLRRPAPAGSLPVLATPLRWPDLPRAEHVDACNACGQCRSREPHTRMCPVFRATRDEAASPRAKVHLIRQIAAGELDPKTWGAEELKRNADLCVHCNLCESECPSGVDVSALMVEAKAAYAENHGLAPDDWMLSRIDRWAAWASRLPILFNTLMSSRRARWALERLVGLSRHRRLPRAHRSSFLARAERAGLTTPRPELPAPKVAYFVDLYANHFDQELAEAVVAVLRQSDVHVYVPKYQRGCGMPALVAGDLDRARSLMLANLRALGDAVRDGYTVVCSEPTAALMLRREALRLTDDLDAALVAAHTTDVGAYLADLDAKGAYRRPSLPIYARVGYHQPCHLRAMGVGTPGLDLIRAIPELEVEFIDRGCSGIAGTFGMSRRNFRTSLRAGRGLSRRLRDADIDIGSTECGACRMQMEQGAAKRTIHPIKLLSLAYGLNPSLRLALKEPKPRHEVS